LTISHAPSSILLATAYLHHFLPFLAPPTFSQRTAPQAGEQPPRIEESCSCPYLYQVNSQQGAECTNDGAMVHMLESTPVPH
jgi:hypothetical protein